MTTVASGITDSLYCRRQFEQQTWVLPLQLAASLDSSGETLKHRRLVNVLIWKQPQGRTACIVCKWALLCVCSRWASAHLMHACLRTEWECECMQERANAVLLQWRWHIISFSLQYWTLSLHLSFTLASSTSRALQSQLVREKWNVYLLQQQRYSWYRSKLESIYRHLIGDTKSKPWSWLLTYKNMPLKSSSCKNEKAHW